MTKPIIALYSKTECRQCDATKRWLKQNDFEFDEVDLLDPSEPGNLEAAKALGYAAAPVVVVSLNGVPGDEIHWSGFNPGMLERLKTGAIA